MKRCSKCGAVKPYAEFNRSGRNKDGYHSYCRDCSKAHYRNNILRHKANVRRTSKIRLEQTRILIAEVLRGGCVDCGNTDIRVLEFDHVRGSKLRSVGEMVTRGVGIDVLTAEIEKCEVRCRNCHVIKTFDRRGGSWRDAYLL